MMAGRKCKHPLPADSSFFTPRQGKRGDLENEGLKESEEPSASERRLRALLEGLHKKVDVLDRRMASFESKLESLTTRVTTNERTLQELKGSVKTFETVTEGMNAMQEDYVSFKPHATASFLQMDSRLDNLEDKVLATSVRVLGVPQDFGLDNLGEAMSKYISQTVLKDIPDSQIQVVKAMRVPTRNSNAGDKRGGTVVLTVGDPSQRDLLLRTVIKRGKVELEGERILMFPNLSQGTLKKKRDLLAIRKSLVTRNIQASMLFPAKLRVAHVGKQFIFTNAEAAQQFLDSLP